MLNSPLTTGALWPYLLLIHNYFPQDVLFPLSNLWAMGVTEQFYLILGLFFLVFPHFNYRHGVVFTLVGVAVVCYSLYVCHCFKRPSSLNYITNFGIGLLLAVFCTRESKLFNKIVNHSKSQVFVFYGISLFLVLLGFHMNTFSRLPLMEIILCLGYSYIIINISFGKFKPIRLDKMPFLQRLGKRTFSMYCFHSFVLTGVQKSLSYLQFQISPFILFLIVLPPTILVAQLTYNLIERPIIAFKDRFSA